MGEYMKIIMGSKHNSESRIPTKNKFWEELICYFPYISHLFEVLEPNLVEINISELKLI
jgi:hypothetical protein